MSPDDVASARRPAEGSKLRLCVGEGGEDDVEEMTEEEEEEQWEEIPPCKPCEEPREIDPRDEHTPDR